MLEIVLIIGLIASFQIFCCVLFPEPEDRTRDDTEYMEWLREQKKQKGRSKKKKEASV